ncbi:MAG: DUF4388 domain-containing protein [Candidatus Aminicenantes bacterium]|nr:MAG: DUF4388 domain-containing protein [Candidatus Aminicenantes bacterium]
MISEKGSLKEIPAIKLLLSIFEQGLTGILYIKRADILKVLYFNRGKLIWAISNSDVDKLENILVSKELVDPETIKKVKKEGKVSDSIGKLLVEKGLITLEELIDSSKVQLKRIIISVLKWKVGGFRFVKDPPPERLLSLDLDITQFVADFIVEEVDTGEIWKQIGSLRVEFIKNPDEQKVAKYRLSDKQKELLNSFDGETKLEEILARHAGGHSESLLKIIYFFLMAELLIKKEFELSDLSVFADEKEPDHFEAGTGIDKPVEHDENAEPVESGEPAEPVESIEHIEHVEEIETTINDTGQDAPDVFSRDSEKGTAEVDEDEGKGLESIPPLHDEPAISMVTPGQKAAGEKKPLKLFNITLILVFFILVIAGVILILLPWFEGADQMKNVVERADQGEVKDVITSEKKPPPAQKQDTSKADKMSANGKSAQAYFQEGSFITAADVWKRELIKGGVKYSILLELDCMKESVIHAYKRISARNNFFILNRKVELKNCFLVMWGKFFTYEEASKAVKLVPDYFWQQKNPPKIIELSAYL